MTNTVEFVQDEFVCICGNNPSAQGAFPCDAQGEETTEDDIGGAQLYCCDRCKRIFDYPSGRILRGPQVAVNVFDYFAVVFGVPPEPSGLRRFPIESNCGVTCANIIERGKFLLDACDPHPMIADYIQRGVVHAIEIVCFG